MTDDLPKTLTCESFRSYITERGMRVTPERMAILDKVMDCQRHFTVDDIWSRMSASSFSVSRATVYNNIRLLVDAGIIRRQSSTGNTSSYERITSGAPSHIHLVCLKCGKVKESREPELMKSLTSRRYSAFHPEYAVVNVYGECSSCARKRKSKNRK